VKNPPADLAQRLLDVSEQVLRTDPPMRLEDIAGLVGASRATMYYYFSGRDDLLAFLLTAHTERGAEAAQAAVDPTDPPDRRLQTMMAGLAAYLGRHPGICAGLLTALGATGRMAEVFAEGRTAGIIHADDIADTANAILGALMLAVLGRSMAEADPADPQFHERLSDQLLRSVLPR
jgi:TetR/AcrR family transcriptional regulator